MRKIILISTLFLISLKGIGQGLPLGSPTGNNIQGLKNKKLLGLPVYADTTSATSGQFWDSLGNIIQLKGGGVYFRDTTPGGHKWVQVTTGGLTTIPTLDQVLGAGNFSLKPASIGNFNIITPNPNDAFLRIGRDTTSFYTQFTVSHSDGNLTISPANKLVTIDNSVKVIQNLGVSTDPTVRTFININRANANTSAIRIGASTEVPTTDPQNGDIYRDDNHIYIRQGGEWIVMDNPTPLNGVYYDPTSNSIKLGVNRILEQTNLIVGDPAVTNSLQKNVVWLKDAQVSDVANTGVTRFQTNMRSFSLNDSLNGVPSALEAGQKIYVNNDVTNNQNTYFSGLRANNAFDTRVSTTGTYTFGFNPYIPSGSTSWWQNAPAAIRVVSQVNSSDTSNGKTAWDSLRQIKVASPSTGLTINRLIPPSGGQNSYAGIYVAPQQKGDNTQGSSFKDSSYYGVLIGDLVTSNVINAYGIVQRGINVVDSLLSAFIYAPNIPTATATSLMGRDANGKIVSTSGGVAGATAIDTVNTITDLHNYALTPTTIWVKDPLRGGMFYYQPASAGVTPDSGMNFKSIKGGVYTRQNPYTDGSMLITWWGAQKFDPTNPGTYTSMGAITNMATAYFPNRNGTIIFNGQFKSSTSIIYGEGTVFLGYNTLFPYQTNPDTIRYRSQSAVHFINCNGFSPDTGVVAYRNQKPIWRNLGIFYDGAASDGYYGILFRNNPNSTTALHTTGLAGTYDCYFDHWHVGVGNNDYSNLSSDSYTLQGGQISMCDTGYVMGRSGNTAIYVDFYANLVGVRTNGNNNSITYCIFEYGTGGNSSDTISTGISHNSTKDNIAWNGANFLGTFYHATANASRTSIHDNMMLQTNNNMVVIDSAASLLDFYGNSYVTTSQNPMTASKVFIYGYKGTSIKIHDEQMTKSAGGLPTNIIQLDTITGYTVTNMHTNGFTTPDNKVIVLNGGSGTSQTQVSTEYFGGSVAIYDNNTSNFAGNGKFSMSYDNTTTGGIMYIRGANNTGLGGRIQVTKSEGTQASPSGLSSGSEIFDIIAAGFNTSTTTGTRAKFGIQAAETWSTSVAGTRIFVATTPIGTNTMNAGWNTAGNFTYFGDTSTLGRARVEVRAGTTTIPGIAFGINGVVVTTPVAGALEGTNTSLFYTDTISTVKTRREVALLDKTQTFTNKTITSSTNILGGVTMTLGSDATGDMYYRSAGGLLTRLAAGTTAQGIRIVGGVPVWRDTAAVVSSVGNLSPLFTSNLSAGAITFSLSNAAANTVFGNNTGSSAAPSFQTSLSLSGSGFFGTTLTVNGTSFINGDLQLGSFNHLIMPSSTASSSSITFNTFNYYTGTGGDTWTLPALSSNVGKTMFFKNRGSGNVTIAAAGADQIYSTSAVANYVLTPGSAIILQNDSTYWELQ